MTEEQPAEAFGKKHGSSCWPYDYFEHLLIKISKHMKDTDVSFCEELFRWSSGVPKNCMSILVSVLWNAGFRFLGITVSGEKSIIELIWAKYHEKTGMILLLYVFRIFSHSFKQKSRCTLSAAWMRGCGRFLGQTRLLIQDFARPLILSPPLITENIELHKITCYTVYVAENAKL